MRVKQTKFGNMCEVRLRNRRIRVLRLHDKSWAVEFFRPAKSCGGLDEDHSCEHRVFSFKNRVVMTGMRLSREAMTAFCDAVATLVEFEQGGVEVGERW